VSAFVFAARLLTIFSQREAGITELHFQPFDRESPEMDIVYGPLRVIRRIHVNTDEQQAMRGQHPIALRQHNGRSPAMVKHVHADHAIEALGSKRQTLSESAEMMGPERFELELRVVRIGERINRHP
jgi:hypothetical protein